MATPDTSLAGLLVEVTELRGVVAELKALVAAQAAEITELRRRLSLNSRNSSKPPSSDGPNVPARSLRKPSGRERGGQAGHEPHDLAFARDPDVIREHRPGVCERCGEGIAARPAELASRHQVVDVPPIRAHVTEHRVYASRCACGHLTCAGRPPGLPACPVSYGRSVEALVAYLSARHYLPVARLGELLADVLGVEPAAGTVHAMVARAAGRLAGTVAGIKAAITSAAVVGSDETPIREGGERREAWVWHSDDAVYMARGPSRSSEVHRREFPGGLPEAVLVTDRLAAQLNMPAARHQVCLAHIMRRCVGLDEAAGATYWPAEMLEVLGEVCERGALGRACDATTRERLARELDKLLSDAHGELPEGEGKLRRSLAKDRERMLVCLERAEVPPDNNASERAIRNLKVKLKVSGQWGGAAGTKAYLALRSVIETAIRRGVRPLAALSDPATLGLQLA